MATDKSRCVHAIQQLQTYNPSVKNARVTLKSPQFEYGLWRIGAEHQRRFKSVVLEWLGLPENLPAGCSGWRPCPPSDRAKGWHYRASFDPDKLDCLVKDIDNIPLKQADVQYRFERLVRKAMNEPASRRRARLASAAEHPRRIRTIGYEYARNPDVVAEVLFRAKGRCSLCDNPAPFLRRIDGTPYLEVHHIIPLAAGGEDMVSNAQALCPNCHRKAHYA